MWGHSTRILFKCNLKVKEKRPTAFVIPPFMKGGTVLSGYLSTVEMQETKQQRLSP
jgi:hypothetical protein